MVLEGNNIDDWDDVFGSDEQEGNRTDISGSGGIFLRLKPREEPFRVRIIFKPVRFRKHFEAFRSLTDSSLRYPISPAFDPSEKEKDVAWSEGKYLPSKRYAVPVINRESGDVQIMEAGASVFNAFKNYIKLAKANPASAETGPDWIIKVEKTLTMPDYSCVADPAGPKPLTDEEKKKVKDFETNMQKLTQDKYGSDLGWKYYYQPLTSEKISELYSLLPEDRKVKKKKDEGDNVQSPKIEEKKQDNDQLPGLEQPAKKINAEPVIVESVAAQPAVLDSEPPETTAVGADESSADDAADFF